jgi:branched-chain amino acid transport system substrate-binding protein
MKFQDVKKVFCDRIRRGRVVSKGVRFFAVGILALLLLSCERQGPEAPKSWRIGVPVSLTGIFGKDGNLVKDAYTLWQETVNAGGGMNGHPVEIIFYDDKSDPSVNAKLTEQLIISDKVDLLLGGFGSTQLFAGSAVAEKYQYPLISGAASANKIFDRGFKYYFSTLGRATEEVRGCVELFTAVTPRPKTAAIVGADILFTALACEGFKKYCSENGIDVIHFELFPMALEDYNSLLLKAKNKNPDILLVGSHLLVAMKTIKAMKEIDFNPKAVAFSYGPTVPEFIKELKEDAEYVIAASEWTPNMPYKDRIFGSAADFNQMYFQRFKRYPDFVEAASAGGALAQQMSIEELKLKPPLKKEDRVAVMEKLHSRAFDTFYGKMEFDKDGANVAHPPVAVQVQNGKLMNVFPLEFAESKIRYPFKPWKER